MAKISSKTTTGLNLQWVLLTTALGQFFLAQNRSVWTLAAGLAIFTLAFWKQRSLPPPALDRDKPLPWEGHLFILIFLFGAGILLWRLDSFPPGLYDDQGEIGYCALRILHESWRPLTEIFHYSTPFGLEFYQLAGWFSLFGQDVHSLHLYFIFLSLSAFPLLYWIARRLAGPFVAVGSMFFLAVMRWQWIEARSAHSSIEAPLYLLSLILLFHHGTRERKPTPLILAAFFAGLGFYGYQSLKVLPLVWAGLMAYEWIHSPTQRDYFRRYLPWATLVFLLAVSPYLYFCLSNGTLGYRESEINLFQGILREKNLFPLARSIGGTLLILNRQGPNDAFHNIPGHRLLDDTTAVLFLLGLAWAWRQRQRPEAAYPLISFGIMALPGLLTMDPGASQRFTGWMPWVAYFAGCGLKGIWDISQKAWPRYMGWRRLLVVILLAGVAVQNTITYFIVQAQDLRCREAFEPERTFIGREIQATEKSFPGRYHYLMDPLYVHNPTVNFLAYASKDRIGPFLASEWAVGREKGMRSALVFLNGDETGVVGFLQSLFPQGQTRAYINEMGRTSLYLFILPEIPQAPPLWNRGLRGSYFSKSEDLNSQSWLDPVLNFSSRSDFPPSGPSPLQIRWTGDLEIRRAGSYQFQVLSDGPEQFWLDGKEANLPAFLVLSKGSHPLSLNYEKGTGYFSTIHLIWKKPGDENWEVVPPTAFGTPRKAAISIH